MTELHLVEVDRTVPRLALSVREAARAVNVSEKHFRDEFLPHAPHMRAGRRVLIPLVEFRAWLGNQSKPNRKAEQNAFDR